MGPRASLNVMEKKKEKFSHRIVIPTPRRPAANLVAIKTPVEEGSTSGGHWALKIES